jgi:hypothetical protein
MKLKFLNAEGAPQEVSMDDAAVVGLYREAQEAGVSLPALLSRKFPTDAAKYGTAFEQFCAHSGLFVRSDRGAGIRVPSMHDVLTGKAMIDQGSMQAGTVVRDASPASRALFPAIIVEAIENKLKLDLTTDVNLFDQIIATEVSIAGDKYDQPVLDFSRPEAARHQGIAQLSLPNSMLSITASDVSRKIPTLSLGLEISDQAAKIVSLDLVSLALTRQAEVERNARVQDYLKAIVLGDTDMGMAALAANAMVATYDGAAVAGTPTHKAWVKFLRANWKKRHINFVLAELDSFIKIENRTGKPTVQTDDPKSPRINATFDLRNPQWQNVNGWIVDDGTFGADKVLGIDTRYGLVRARNISADYAAVEEFVLRRSKAMRFDFGEIVYRLFDAAFEYMNMAA